MIMNKNMKELFTSEEKKIIIEELEDIQDHYESLIKSNVFENQIEKEEAINRVDTIEGILKKV